MEYGFIMSRTIITALSVGFMLCAFSINVQAEDYSQGHNPFAKRYIYKSEAQILAEEQSQLLAQQGVVNYFNSNIQNPIILRNSSKKYASLQANAQALNGCWDKAGAAYGVDPWLLFSIAKVESSFNGRAINANRNGTYDLGLMQINSFWLPTLRKFGIDTRQLFEPCTSVFVGAWIVSQNIRRFGYNQDGIGAYNSPGNIGIRRNYARKVYQAYYELTHDFLQAGR